MPNTVQRYGLAVRRRKRCNGPTGRINQFRSNPAGRSIRINIKIIILKSQKLCRQHALPLAGIDRDEPVNPQRTQPYRSGVGFLAVGRASSAVIEPQLIADLNRRIGCRRVVPIVPCTLYLAVETIVKRAPPLFKKCLLFEKT